MSELIHEFVFALGLENSFEAEFTAYGIDLADVFYNTLFESFLLNVSKVDGMKTLWIQQLDRIGDELPEIREYGLWILTGKIPDPETAQNDYFKQLFAAISKTPISEAFDPSRIDMASIRSSYVLERGVLAPNQAELIWQQLGLPVNSADLHYSKREASKIYKVAVELEREGQGEAATQLYSNLAKAGYSQLIPDLQDSVEIVFATAQSNNEFKEVSKLILEEIDKRMCLLEVSFTTAMGPLDMNFSVPTEVYFANGNKFPDLILSEEEVYELLKGFFVDLQKTSRSFYVVFVRSYQREIPLIYQQEILRLTAAGELNLIEQIVR